mmetsp:Transcript_32492/g.68141  ORF Transcript_32492/g.68141 Transcript_32492/m.68141 type:complete len:208 (+) Transcript_32492:6119-6742(+)
MMPRSAARVVSGMVERFARPLDVGDVVSLERELRPERLLSFKHFSSWLQCCAIWRLIEARVCSGCMSNGKRSGWLTRTELPPSDLSSRSDPPPLSRLPRRAVVRAMTVTVLQEYIPRMPWGTRFKYSSTTADDDGDDSLPPLPDCCCCCNVSSRSATAPALPPRPRLRSIAALSIRMHRSADRSEDRSPRSSPSLTCTRQSNMRWEN